MALERQGTRPIPAVWTEVEAGPTPPIQRKNESMKRCTLAGLILALAVAPALAAEDAADVHRGLLVFDPHVDVPAPYDWAKAGRVDRPAFASDQIATDKLVAGGYDAIGLAVFVPQGARTPETYRVAREEADAKLAYIKGLARDPSGRYVVARSASEIRDAHRAGKIAVLPTLLNAFPLGPTADGLDHFHEQGIRILGLTHAGHNDFADSNRPQDRDVITEHAGLSREGRRLIERANELGILVDVSQLSDAAFREALQLTRAPVIASHSGVHSIAPSPRSLTDEELDALKRNGGVVGIVAFSSYLVPTPADAEEKIAEILQRYGAVNGYEGLTAEQRDALAAERAAVRPRASVEDLVNAIDHAVRRIGIDHVAISSDFNHGGGVTGWDDAAGAGAVTRALLERGYSAEQVAKLWGGNVLRVLEAAESASRSSS
jgi:membrane dipeptidase